jgi:hypothetical protein
VAALTPQEGVLADETNMRVIERPWNLWKRSIPGF